MALPEAGMPADTVLATIQELRRDDVDMHDGKAFTNAYLVSDSATRVAEQAYLALLWENGLDPTQIPSFRRMENELSAFALGQLRAPEGAVGTFTSGGTESCMLATKAARDHARAERGIRGGNIVIPLTAHPCFVKAAHYLDLDVITVPVGPDYKAVPAAMAAAMNDKTVMMVGSAPSYPHGVVDPIPELAAIAEKAGVWFHTDGCVGAWLLPFFREHGNVHADYDFGVQGVCSVSMDLHKYAFTAKGASMVLYRSAQLRRHLEYFASSSWPGYTIVNSAIQSSRTCGPVAAAWATMRHLGREGYRDAAGKLYRATRELEAGLADIPGIELLGKPEFCLAAVASSELPIFAIGSAVQARGWTLFPQFSCGGLPATLHISLLPNNVDNVAGLLADLRHAVEDVRANPPEANLAQALAGFDLASLSMDQLAALLENLGLAGDGPMDMGEINSLLDAMPPVLRERVATVFFDLLHRPVGLVPA